MGLDMHSGALGHGIPNVQMTKIKIKASSNRLAKLVAMQLYYLKSMRRYDRQSVMDNIGLIVFGESLSITETVWAPCSMSTSGCGDVMLNNLT